MQGDSLQVSVSEVRYAPGGVSGPHQHSCPVVGYVLEGAVRWAVNGQPPRVITAGESFYETLGDVHSTSANASATEPARFLAIFTCDGGKSPVTTPVPPKP
jgi:quercetin dioxygenase-like cupin family protein